MCVCVCAWACGNFNWQPRAAVSAPVSAISMRPKIIVTSLSDCL